MLRANLKSSKVSVIPNAVDSSAFTPDTSVRPSAVDESMKLIKKMYLYFVFFSCYHCS